MDRLFQPTHSVCLLLCFVTQDAFHLPQPNTAEWQAMLDATAHAPHAWEWLLQSNPLLANSKQAIGHLSDDDKAARARDVFRVFGYFYLWWIERAEEFARRLRAMIQKLMRDKAISVAQLIEINGQVDMVTVMQRPEFTQVQEGDNESLQELWATIVKQIKQIMQLDDELIPIQIKVLMCKPAFGLQSPHRDTNNIKYARNISIVMNLTDEPGHYTASMPKWPLSAFPKRSVENDDLNEADQKQWREAMPLLHEQFFCKVPAVLGGVMVIAQPTWHFGSKNENEEGQDRLVSFEILSAVDFHTDPDQDGNQLFPANGQHACMPLAKHGAAAARALGGQILHHSQHNVLSHYELPGVQGDEVQEEAEYAAVFCRQEIDRTLCASRAGEDLQTKMRQDRLFPRETTPFLATRALRKGAVDAIKARIEIDARRRLANELHCNYADLDDVLDVQNDPKLKEALAADAAEVAAAEEARAAEEAAAAPKAKHHRNTARATSAASVAASAAASPPAADPAVAKPQPTKSRAPASSTPKSAAASSKPAGAAGGKKATTVPQRATSARVAAKASAHAAHTIADLRSVASDEATAEAEAHTSRRKPVKADRSMRAPIPTQKGGAAARSTVAPDVAAVSPSWFLALSQPEGAEALVSLSSTPHQRRGELDVLGSPIPAMSHAAVGAASSWHAPSRALTDASRNPVVPILSPAPPTTEAVMGEEHVPAAEPMRDDSVEPPAAEHAAGGTE